MDNKVKILILSVFAIFSFGFNFFIQSGVKAQSSSTAVDIDNLLFQHNKIRKENFLPEFKYNSRLSTSASLKGYEMVIYDCWSHYCPEGKSPWKFFEESFYEFVIAGENLAEGFFEVNDVMDAWMNSKSHKDNILNSEFTEIGFSVLDTDYLGKVNNKLVVVHFGKSFKQDQMPAKKIIITSPPNKTSVEDGIININGVTQDFDAINLISNKGDQYEVKIVNGRFEVVQDFQQGRNFVYAKGISSLDKSLALSSLTEYFVEGEAEPTVVSTLEGSDFEIEKVYKNSFNLLIIIFLGGFFFIDLAIIIQKKRKNLSMNHYHLSILIILGFIIFAGGFGGEIINGIKI